MNRFYLLSLLALAGCSSSGLAPTPTSTLVYGRSEDANTLDPIHTDIGEAVNVIVNLFDTLVTYHDETTEIVPALAERWEHSEDGLTWTFQLRPDVVFHDGEKLDASAVVYSLERLIQDDHPDLYEQARPYKPSYDMIRAVRATDERTVVVELKEPSAIFLKNLAMFPASIVSPAAVKKLGAKFAEQPVGTGPFRVRRWDRDQKIVLDAFPKHWRGGPGIEHLIFLPVKENATRIEQLKRGEIHIADNLPPQELDVLAERKDIVVQEAPAMNVCYLSLQMEKPPLDDLRVREAIALAIDKPEFLQIAFGGKATAAKSLVPPSMWGHATELVDTPFDRARAKELLAEAAKDKGFELPLKITLSVMSQARPYMQRPIEAAGFLKDSLREIGIELQIESRGVSEHFIYAMAGRHQLALAGWQSDNSDPDNFLYSLLDLNNISEHGNNLSRYRSSEFHQLMIAGQRELDEAKRLKLYERAQELVLEDLPVVPLAHTLNRVAQSSRVQGYVLHPTGMVRLRAVKLAAER
jgi:peptide/nickel transport system substrate-binding protein